MTQQGDEMRLLQLLKDLDKQGHSPRRVVVGSVAVELWPEFPEAATTEPEGHLGAQLAEEDEWLKWAHTDARPKRNE